MKKSVVFSLIGIVSLAVILIGSTHWPTGIRNTAGVADATIPLPVEYRKNTTPEYPMINPLIFIDTDQRFFTEFDYIDAKIDSFIKDATRSNKVTSMSVYFRDMNSGHWTGVNVDEKYEPSSMTKVAVLISYLRVAIQDRSFLSKNLYYSGQDQTGQYYTATSSLSAGYHSIKEIMDRMIVDSDNVAATLLVSNNLEQFKSVYEDFRLPSPPDNGRVQDYMSAKSYSVVFRSLYNASYLLRVLSEQALELLTKTTFMKGLVAGIPSNLVIAHKFGEHTYALSDGTPITRELHDCGIIYYPNHPYFLCVMTKGRDFPSLEKIISGISKLTYDYVNEQKIGI